MMPEPSRSGIFLRIIGMRRSATPARSPAFTGFHSIAAALTQLPPVAPGCAHSSARAQPARTIEKLSTRRCKSVLLWKHFPFWRN
ncbi:hypothetical protein C1W90_07020 [Burkholderia pseudomallei]|uniref:Uncharacterized protein n=1 Tax=Burkholderia pseudomallei TaxID=28450 RepID=A0AAX0UAF1_BURPE|nr:hypothetical protein [Burkholderia pseudomallei]MUU83310.1 hypothetical protein [Burkholderia pseudomallei]MXK55010.1 hypothetical protein [Burkholderia pseudomallei]MXN54478.1 hypothetical protein [Burkholderia pseudomallei]NAX12378.1 hypothetical protein [Burkholderia pseudomallei]